VHKLTINFQGRCPRYLASESRELIDASQIVILL